MPKSVIITCAITGSLHTPSMSPHLPITPQQIAAESIAAAKAGAAILHLHARDPVNGRPTADPGVFQQFLPRIREGCDAQEGPDARECRVRLAGSLSSTVP